MKSTLGLAIVLLLTTTIRAADFEVDCSKQSGVIRALHGGNGGTLCDGGLTDLSGFFREIRMPLMRLHDCHWPNSDVVDMHVVFPNPRADPADAASYDFARTDEYIASIRATGSRIVYRLGESIEHTKIRRHVHPPADYERWVGACVGIVGHYQEVEYWEIWNEPENRPAMWSGTDEDYLRLYEVAAKKIKGKYPKVKIGGPSLGYSGKIVDGKFAPSAFMRKFLEHCKKESASLDFFSWHLYGNDPGECVIRARAIRAVLDEYGFDKTESHFNEWNYLPGKDWKPMTLAGQGEARRKFNEQMAGMESAAFAASVLINLQDSPVDQANYFRADNGGFGLFAADGVPNKPFYSFKAFAMLLETPRRVAVSGGKPSEISICAGREEAGEQVRLLMSNYKSVDGEVRVKLAKVPWSGASRFEIYELDGEHNLSRTGKGRAENGELVIPLRAPAVCLIVLTPDSRAR